MSRALIIIGGKPSRERIASWAWNAPAGTRVEFKEAKRTTEQNAAMWAALTDIARQLPWHGVKLSPDDWKLIFLDALKQEMRLVPNIAGTGFINLGRSSSDLSKAEMSDLLDLIRAFAAERGIELSDPQSEAA